LANLIDDRYELVEVIASGGMASVWRARDTRLDRLVALKRPHPGGVDDTVHQRMEREARAAASLSHPHLVTVYDFGRDDAGPYIVMELVEGRTLEDMREEIEPAHAMAIGAQIAEALAAIHAVGIIHRDVKPANVLMSDRGPLLTDFGLALHPEVTTRITQPGKVAATPQYAAPEVMAGEPPTSASDVFSLALVVYELVSGARLPPGLTGDLPPLDDQTIDHTLRTALSRAPEERPPAEAFASSLRGSAPTLATVPNSNDPTLVMNPLPTPHQPVAIADEEPDRRPALFWSLAAVLAMIVALGFAVRGLSDPETEVSVTADLPVSTTQATTTTILPTTTVDAVESVQEARQELAAILLSSPRSSLNPKEAKEILEKVDEAIELVGEGDLEKASEKLRDTAKKIDDKLDDEQLEEARSALEELADALGIPLEDDGDGDQGDD